MSARVLRDVTNNTTTVTCAAVKTGTQPQPQASPEPIIISIEAAIGTGKSTLLRLLKEHEPTWTVVQEPVDHWQDVSGHNLLDAFYSNLERYAFSFQTYCVLSRIESVTSVLADISASSSSSSARPVVVLERSWFSDRHTFAAMLHRGGKMSDMEWELYKSWYSFAVKNSPAIHGHVYLECSSGTCMERLQRRHRDEEVGVTEGYQKDLIAEHEAWLSTLEPDAVHRVNVDEDFKETPEKVVEQIRKFVSNISSKNSAAVLSKNC